MLIIDSVTKNFSLSKSTLGRLRPVVRCADKCILGMKYIVSPILLPAYIVYAFVNPVVKDARVEVLQTPESGSTENDTEVRKGKILSQIPGGKMRRQHSIARNERKLVDKSDGFPINIPSGLQSSSGISRYTVKTTKDPSISLSSSSSSSANSTVSTQVGMRVPMNVYIPKSGEEKTYSNTTTFEETSDEASSGIGRGSKIVGNMTQQISGPSLSDLSPFRHEGYFIHTCNLTKERLNYFH